jgi:hypothetical protein
MDVARRALVHAVELDFGGGCDACRV